MSSDDVWVIGTAMTKFGRFPDKDELDLATEVALGALADGTTIQDMGVLSVGNVYKADSHNAQRLQKQIGQTGIPAYNVINACATGATAVRVAWLSIKAGETDFGPNCCTTTTCGSASRAGPGTSSPPAPRGGTARPR